MTTDPILPKAARTSAAWAEYGAVCSREPREGSTDTPEHQKWRGEQDRAQREWESALADVLATQPQTREGAAAMIDAVLLWEKEQLEGDHDDVLTLLERLRAFLAAN